MLHRHPPRQRPGWTRPGTRPRASGPRDRSAGPEVTPARWAPRSRRGRRCIAKIRVADARTRWSACVAAGRPDTSSNAASGTRASEPSQTPSSRPEWTWGPRPTRMPQIAAPERKVVRPSPMPAVAADVVGHRRQRRVDRVDPPELGVGRTVDRQLRRSLDEVDHRGCELAAQCRRLARADQRGRRSATAPGRPRRAPRQRVPRRPPAEGPHHENRHAAHQRGDREGGDDPHHDVLHRVDVRNQPGHQVPAAERGEPRRCEAFESAVETDPHRGEHPKAASCPTSRSP